MKYFVNLEGKTFGRWLVLSRNGSNKYGSILWLCKCSCGTIKSVNGHTLRIGNSQSCGCYNNELAQKLNFKDLTNQKFTNLTVISITDKRTKDGNIFWNCLCNCGNTKLINSHALLRGHTKSCGCLQKSNLTKRMSKDLNGQKFGKLTVIECVGKNKWGSYLWKCVCDCGKVKNYSCNSLCMKNSTTCGCGRRENFKLHTPSKSSTMFLDSIEKTFNIQIQREFQIYGKYYDGKFNDLLIEVDCVYWHKNFKENDKLKNKIAKNNGYKLIRCRVNSQEEVQKRLHQYLPKLRLLVEQFSTVSK